MNKNKRKKQDLLVGIGEATGHVHVLRGVDSVVYKKDDETGEVLDFELFETGEVVHDEHHVQTLPPGRYTVGTVQQYDYLQEMQRRVED